MALLAEQVPKYHREFVRLVGEAELLGAFDECLLRIADRRDAGEIALDVRSEYRDAGAREALGENLQRHGLARARRTGHQSVPITVMQGQILGLATLADKDLAVLIEIRHRRSRETIRRTLVIVRSPQACHCSCASLVDVLCHLGHARE
jgi:hypothetical protein